MLGNIGNGFLKPLSKTKSYKSQKHLLNLFLFSLFENELDYVERLLEEDIRNNSAWNQRFFVNQNLHQKIEGDLLNKELEFTMNAIEKVPGNESAWNYLNG